MSENYRKDVPTYNKYCDPRMDTKSSTFHVYRPHSMRKVNACFELNRLQAHIKKLEADLQALLDDSEFDKTVFQSWDWEE